MGAINVMKADNNCCLRFNGKSVSNWLKDIIIAILLYCKTIGIWSPWKEARWCLNVVKSITTAFPMIQLNIIQHTLEIRLLPRIKMLRIMQKRISLLKSWSKILF